MKKLYGLLGATAIAAMICAVAPSANAQQLDTTKYFLGVNWMQFDGDQTALANLYDDTLHCSLFHLGVTLPEDSSHWDSMIVRFPKLYAVQHYGGAISRYSGAEFMLYQGIRQSDLQNAGDSLKEYFFGEHPKGTGYNATVGNHNPPYDHWEISDSTANTDVVVMSGNQFPTVWSDGAASAFDIAIKLQVASTSASDTSHVADVYAIQSHYNGSAYVRDTGCVFGIQWKWFNAANADSVFFTPQRFHFTQDFTPWGATPDSMILEIHSARIVTTRISFCGVCDTDAFNMLAGVYLDKSVYSALSDSVAAQIWRDSSLIYSVFGSHLLWVYLVDEPVLSQYSTTAYCNFLLHYRGNCEVGGDRGQMARYIAQVQPKPLFWNAAGVPYPWQITDYLDSGIINAPLVYDSTLKHWVHPISQWQTYKDGNYGYFPYDPNNYAANAHYKPAHDLALDSSYATGGGADCNSDFDPYELRQGCFGALADPSIAGEISESNFVNGLHSDTTTSWMANVFVHSHLDSLGFYPGAAPMTPAERAAFFNGAILGGAKGILFFTGETNCCDGSWDQWSYLADSTPPYKKHIEVYNTGFTDGNGLHDSDENSIGGTLTPTLYKRSTLWLEKYADTLMNKWNELRSKQWYGGYVNYIVQDASHPDHIVRCTQSWGGDSLALIDTSYHHSTRYILSKWPAGVDSTKNDTSLLNYRLIQSAGDSLVRLTAMPDSLTLAAYGYFKSSNPTSDTAWLAELNLFTDERDILTRWIANDTASYLQRGEREIYTRIRRDTNIAKYFQITALSNNWDTIIPGAGTNAIFHYHLKPGAMEVFRITPAFNFPIAAGKMDYNNGRRGCWDGGPAGAPVYRFTYYRNDSVFVRQSLDSTGVLWGAEYVLAAGTAVDSFAHPSLRILNDGSEYAIGVAYEMADSANYTVYLRVNAAGDDTSWGAPIRIDQFPKDSEEFAPAPVLVPYDYSAFNDQYGFIVAYSRNITGIGVRAYDIWNDTLGTLVRFNAVHNHGYPDSIADMAAGFPTIAEDSAGAGRFGLAFQQQRKGRGAQIFFTVGSVSYTGKTPVVSVDTTPAWVSKMYGPYCENLHPSLDRSHSHDSLAVADVVHIGGGTWKAQSFIVNVIANHGSSSTYYPWLWNLAWDAPLTITMKDSVTGSINGIINRNVIWEAMVDMRESLAAQQWAYNLFEPQGEMDYSYPSVRAFDGIDSAHCLPAALGWLTSDSTVLIARSPIAYPPALPAMPNTFIIAPIVESGNTQSTLLTPLPATTPNLEMNGHDNLWYSKQRAFYADLRKPDLRILANPIVDMDTAGNWRWRGNVFYQLKNSSATCAQTVYTAYPIWIMPKDTIEPNPRVQFTAMKLPQDSAAWAAGLIAVSDTMHVGASDSAIAFVRAVYTPDTSALSTALGGGQIRYYLEAASEATGATLLAVDSIIVQSGNLGLHDDTLTATLSLLRDSAIFFRVRMVDTTAPNMTGFVAQGYRALDTNSPPGFAKTLRHLGRGVDAEELPNPIMMQLAPNPTKTSTQIFYSVPVEDADDVTEVKIFNSMAQDVTTLVHDIKPAGRYELTFNGTALPAGEYVVSVREKSHQQSRLLILVR